MIRTPLALCAALLISVSAVSPSQAAAPRFLQSYGDWDTYSYTENGNKVCYMASRPQKAEGNYTRRGEIFAYITHRPDEGTKDVFGYVTGYTYQKDSQASLAIDGQKISLVTVEDKAWSVDEASDKRITDLVKKGSTMIMRGTSSRGTKTKDTFSLKGSTAAYNRITKDCGI